MALVSAPQEPVMAGSAQSSAQEHVLPAAVPAVAAEDTSSGMGLICRIFSLITNYVGPFH